MKNHLKSFIVLCVCLIAFSTVNAQLGIRTKYLSNSIDNDQSRLINTFGMIEDAFSSGYGLGVDYWFRLKDKRIEFLPEIGINLSSSDFSGDGVDVSQKFTYAYLNLNTRVYPMDFGGDCDCPTFSNQSTLIKKGFYFELSPGIGLSSTTLDVGAAQNATAPIEVGSYDNNALSYKIGLGVGLDIGISNLLTINPYAMYNYHFNRDYASVWILESGLDPTYGNTMSQLELGVRFAFRFDAKNY